jgi:hypothetical protein
MTDPMLLENGNLFSASWQRIHLVYLAILPVSGYETEEF